MEEAFTIVEKGAGSLSEISCVHSISHLERKLVPVYHLLSVFKTIYGGSDDLYFLFVEVRHFPLKVGNLPMTKRSPQSAVHEQYGPVILCRIRQQERAAIHELEIRSGEKISAVKFSSFYLSHDLLLPDFLRIRCAR